RSDPLLEAVAFTRDLARVVGGVGEKACALDRGKKVEREGARLRPLADQAKLRLEPLEAASEEVRRPLCQWARLLVPLRTAAPPRATAARDRLADVDRRLDEGHDPVSWLELRFPRRALRRHGDGHPLDEGLPDRVLGFEVIIDVPERHPRLVRNVRERG